MFIHVVSPHPPRLGLETGQWGAGLFHTYFFEANAFAFGSSRGMASLSSDAHQRRIILPAPGIGGTLRQRR